MQLETDWDELFKLSLVLIILDKYTDKSIEKNYIDVFVYMIHIYISSVWDFNPYGSH